MNVKQSKDFLVQQAAEQAALESIPLSELEKRMMYFTEGKDATEDPVELNEQFEAQYNMAEFEAKISKLLRHARSRLKEENPETGRQWDQAVRFLHKSDHYILVLLDENESVGRSSHDSLKLFLTACAFIAVMGIGIWSFERLAERHRWHWDLGKRSGPPTGGTAIAPWINHLLQGLLVVGLVYVLIGPWATKSWAKYKGRKQKAVRSRLTNKN